MTSTIEKPLELQCIAVIHLIDAPLLRRVLIQSPVIISMNSKRKAINSWNQQIIVMQKAIISRDRRSKLSQVNNARQMQPFTLPNSSVDLFTLRWFLYNCRSLPAYKTRTKSKWHQWKDPNRIRPNDFYSKVRKKKKRLTFRAFLSRFLFSVMQFDFAAPFF